MLSINGKKRKQKKRGYHGGRGVFQGNAQETSCGRPVQDGEQPDRCEKKSVNLPY